VSYILYIYKECMTRNIYIYIYKICDFSYSFDCYVHYCEFHESYSVSVLVYASHCLVLNCGLIVFSHVFTIPTPVTKTLLLVIEYQFEQK
jgi:hypothetical protein